MNGEIKRVKYFQKWNHEGKATRQLKQVCSRFQHMLQIIETIRKYKEQNKLSWQFGMVKTSNFTNKSKYDVKSWNS